MPVNINSIVELANARLQKLHHPIFMEKNVGFDILRLDTIHPVIAGNKFFKLKYSLEDTILKHYKGIITSGGAWSNHLVACAAACRALGLKSKAIIRGEKPAILSGSLRDVVNMGMELEFVSRAAFHSFNESLQNDEHGDYYPVPMGGHSIEGIKGASEIMELIPQQHYDIVCCSIGTGTMMAGLLKKANIPVMGFSALKTPDTVNNEIEILMQNFSENRNYTIQYDFHFGGFGKTTPGLLQFMNDFHQTTGVPTDIVYTGKMMYGLVQLVQQGYFSEGTRICAIHSGGLQGNRSVKTGTLLF